MAAVSARPFARAAAAAGFRVVAADAFGDADTRACAALTLRLRHADGGFEAAGVRRLLPLLAGGAGLVYGSGFETQPALLAELACYGNLHGNSAETVGMLKHPGRFFALLRRLGIPFPQTRRAPPTQPAGWLSKLAGGSGGVHVAAAVDGTAGGPARYFQRRVPGLPCSLLFLADGRDIVEVGCNLQWLAPAANMPYRYGGAVSRAPLPGPVRAAMREAAQRITVAAGLRGLNSLDCMADGEAVWVLEVNPRLTASFALYDMTAAGANLLRAHLSACAGRLAWPAREEEAGAHLIYYAPFDVTVPSAVAWPAWVADVPRAGSRVAAGEPLCSIMARAPDAAAATELVRQRTRELQERLQHGRE